MAGQTQGAQTKLSIEGDNFCFMRIEDRSTYSLVDGSEGNICGGLDRCVEQVTEGVIIPRLHMLFQPSPQELELLLPIIGFEEDDPGEWFPSDFTTLALFDLMISRGTADTYANGIADKVIFRGQKGKSPLSLEIQAVFESRPIIVTSGGFVGDDLTFKTSPFAFSQGVMQLDEDTDVAFNSGVLVIDHHINMEHNNSVTPHSNRPTDRTFHFGVNTPYTSDELHILTSFTGAGTASPSSVGFPGSWSFTRGGDSLVFNFHNLKWEAQPPSILGREEVRMMPFFQAYGSCTDGDAPVSIFLTADDGEE